jgi:predicted phage terminase large subunit-like protein
MISKRIVAGDMRKYICNLPPGFGKTFLMAVTLVAWILARNPSARILIVSYGEEPVLLISKKIRALLLTGWFQRAFPKTKLAKGQQAAADFATTAGGAVYARSINGAITGLRCDYLICDDMVQIRDGTNLQALEFVNDRFHADLVTRLNPPGTIVIVAHRLNPMDLTGYLLARHKDYKHRVLPLIATEDRKYRLKNGIWHRKEGHILRPNVFTSEDIADLREHTGLPGFAPLYQQRFEGLDVIQVQPDEFVIQSFYTRPAITYILSIDPNHKGSDGQSFSVVQVWGILQGRKYLLFDQWRGRAHKSTLAAHIRRMKSDYRCRVILIEDNGPALDLQEQFETSACPVILLTPRGDKVARLRRHLALFRNGQIVLRAGVPFIEELIAEFKAFPCGANDDQVDAATQFLDYIESNDPPPPSKNRHTGSLGDPRRARATLYWNGGRPSGPYVFSRR